MPRPSPSSSIAVAALAALAYAWTARGGDGAPVGGPPGAAGDVLRGRVVRVTDGDTIRVALGNRSERVRYIGIDTPEEVRPDTPVQCYARRAAAENARLVGRAAGPARLDVEARDRFGRLLAYVYRAGDGLFVNAALVRGGFARTLDDPAEQCGTPSGFRRARCARRGARPRVMGAQCASRSSLLPPWAMRMRQS
jgi:micrococcal nuclease